MKKLWICYTIRKEDGFRQLSIIAKNLQEIYNFITTITNIDSKDFIFEIEFNATFKTEEEN